MPLDIETREGTFDSDAPSRPRGLDPGVVQYLRRVRRRLRVAWLLDALQSVAVPTAAAVLCITATGWITPWPRSESVAAALAVGVVAGTVVAGLVVRMPLPTAARAADRGLRSHDALATALELDGELDADGDFVADVHARAVEVVSGARPGAAVEVRLRRRPLASAALLAAGAVALALVDSPEEVRRARAERTAEQVAPIADALEQEAERLRADPAAADVAERLEALAERLRDAEDLDAADELLRTGEDALRRLGENADSLAMKAAAQGLERSLASEPLPGADPSATASEQIAAAAAQLDQLDAQQAAALADRLDALAAAQVAGDPETAAALRDAARMIRQGNTSGARAALGEAAAAHSRASDDAAAHAAAGEAAAAAGAAREAVDGARQRGDANGGGDGDGDGSGEGSGSGSGSGQGSGQGNGNGNGSGEGQGNGGQGSGSGGGGGSPSGDVSGGGGGSTPGGTGGAGQGSGTGPGSDDETPSLGEESVFDPGTPGEEEIVGGGTGPGEGDTVGTVDGPTNAGTSRVPLAERIDAYVEEATEAMERGVVPPAQRDLVLRYFDQLQGRR